MSIMEGKERFIKCSTNIIGGPAWHDDGVLKLYFYCYCKASHNTVTWKGIVLQPGDMPLAERDAAVELEWSRNKLDRKLELLEKTGLVSIRPSTIGTLLRINHWQRECGSEMKPSLQPWIQNDATTGSKMEPRPLQSEATDGSEMRLPDTAWLQNEAARGSKMEPNQYISNTKLNTHSLPEVPKAFTQIWLAYPPERRTCRDEAICLFRKAMEDGATVDAMIAALEADKSSYTWSKEGGRYIPGIVKWLQKETWRDYLIAAPAEEEEIWTSR